MKTNEILEDISIAVIVLTRVPINNIFAIKLQKYYFDLNSMTKFFSEEIVFFL